jgi:hypothetical protein
MNPALKTTLGLRPRPRDFLRDELRCPKGEKKKPRRLVQQAGPAPSAHRRLGYSLPGCVPAEPDSASPSGAIVTMKGPRRPDESSRHAKM